MYHCHTGISKRSLGPAAFQEQGGDAHERCLLLDDLVPSCSSEMLQFPFWRLGPVALLEEETIQYHSHNLQEFI